MTHGGGYEYSEDARYWIMPLGFALGCVVVFLFEWNSTSRREIFKQATRKKELTEDMDAKLGRYIDGFSNMANFWSGQMLHLQTDKEHFRKVYEMLALISALLLTISVTFYTATENAHHVYGVICCVANCALWMCTLSATFFAVVISTCETNSQIDLLVLLYGEQLMRVPMMLFVWGCTLLFIEFIIFFKETIDAGFNCSLCLGACFVIAPLFFHCMHKMGWVVAIVHHEDIVKHIPALEDIQTALDEYKRSKPNILACDFDEFLLLLEKYSYMKLTSVQKLVAKRMFDADVDVEIENLELRSQKMQFFLSKTT